jgi:uncharacterized membrane protein
MNSKKILVSLSIISMIVVYCFLVVNVFIGLMNATALQGFSGLMLMAIGLAVLVYACFNVHKLFD